MDKEFVYNPDKPCIVLRNGQDVGALVAGKFYCFEALLGGANEAGFIVENHIFQYGQKIGKLEGPFLILDKGNVVFEIVEP